jgi:hypothetical protein
MNVLCVRRRVGAGNSFLGFFQEDYCRLRFLCRGVGVYSYMAGRWRCAGCWLACLRSSGPFANGQSGADACGVLFYEEFRARARPQNPAEATAGSHCPTSPSRQDEWR